MRTWCGDTSVTRCWWRQDGRYGGSDGGGANLDWLGLAWLGGSGETVKRLDSSNVSNKTAAVGAATVRTGLDGDNGDEITATAAAQAWLATKRRQQRDNSNCGSNGGGANLAWIGGSDKTARRQQNQRRDINDTSDGGIAYRTQRQ